MQSFQALVSSLREQFHATLSRSDVLKSLWWLFWPLLTATITSFSFSTPLWFSIFLTICLGLVMGLYLFAYSFCLLKNPDGLRSERYSLEKMAIEHSVVGDDLSGIIDHSSNSGKGTSIQVITDKVESDK